jgi:heme/copper-type cytochrome/quinol oxidase subunit 3
MGFVAVIVAALAGFGVGAAWYMTLSKPWMEAAGITVGADGRPANGSSPLPFVVAFAAMLLVAGMMRHMLVTSNVEGSGKSLLSGLGVGAFFVAPWLAMDYAYSMRDRRLTWIDGGYAILGCGAIGLVLGLF